MTEKCHSTIINLRFQSLRIVANVIARQIYQRLFNKKAKIKSKLFLRRKRVEAGTKVDSWNFFFDFFAFEVWTGVHVCRLLRQLTLSYLENEIKYVKNLTHKTWSYVPNYPAWTSTYVGLQVSSIIMSYSFLNWSS